MKLKITPLKRLVDDSVLYDSVWNSVRDSVRMEFYWNSDEA